MKKKDSVKELLDKEFFSKFIGNDGKTIGVEIELPIVNLKGKNIKMANIQKLFNLFINKKDFKIEKKDNENNIIAIKNKKYRDILSLEYSVNTLEFSLEEDINIYNIKNRFDKYLNDVQKFLSQFGYELLGSGINPNYRDIDKKCLNDNRYIIIEKLLLNNNNTPILFNQFCAYICSTQTHLTPNINNLVETLNTFSNIEWVKSILYSNSYVEELDSPLSRDYLWQKSSFGESNTGTNVEYKDLNDLIQNYKTRLLNYIERNNEYFIIDTVTLEDYFKHSKIRGINHKNELKLFSPNLNDIHTFRSYKNVEVTRKGTIEIRCDCTQRLDNIFEIVAFNVGVFEMREKIDKLISKYNFDNSSQNNREQKIRCMKINQKEEEFIIQLINLVCLGLKERGNGEEKLLRKINEMREKNEKGWSMVL